MEEEEGKKQAAEFRYHRKTDEDEGRRRERERSGTLKTIGDYKVYWGDWGQNCSQTDFKYLSPVKSGGIEPANGLKRAVDGCSAGFAGIR